MSVRKSDDFIADLEEQAQWYLANAGWEVADHFLDAVETLPASGATPATGTAWRIHS